ncbi:MAG: hypothetical protein ACRC11_15815, partial [Xenococcaceae cyanobacterium]
SIVKNNYKNEKNIEKIVELSFESLVRFLSQICRKIFDFYERDNHLKIWQKTNRFGGIYRQVYNDRTGQRDPAVKRRGFL